jgi:hypothetical protein
LGVIGVVSAPDPDGVVAAADVDTCVFRDDVFVKLKAPPRDSPTPTITTTRAAAPVRAQNVARSERRRGGGGGPAS